VGGGERHVLRGPRLVAGAVAEERGHAQAVEALDVLGPPQLGRRLVQAGDLLEVLDPRELEPRGGGLERVGLRARGGGDAHRLELALRERGGGGGEQDGGGDGGNAEERGAHRCTLMACVEWDRGDAGRRACVRLAMLLRA
jgi:hypothetical protein